MNEGMVNGAIDIVKRIVDEVQKAPTNAYDVQIAKINAVSGVVTGVVALGSVFGICYLVIKTSEAPVIEVTPREATQEPTEGSMMS